MIRAVLLALAAAAVLTALFFARPRATPGPPMRDFEAYYAAGNALRHGADPYGTAIWKSEKALAGVSAQRYELLPFVGPPATLPLWSAFAHLPFGAANAVWRGVLVLFAAALVLVALRLCGLALRAYTFLAIAIFAFGFGPLTSAVALGQIALPAYACAALALIWLPAGILAWAQPNIALALVSLANTRKGAFAFVGGLAIFALGSLLVAGPRGVMHYLAVLRAHGEAERFSSIQITPGAIAYGLGASPALAVSVAVAVAILAAALWLLRVRRLREGIARFCGTCALLPLIIPFFHEHDLIVMFLPALYFSMRCSRRAWPLVAAAALFCATDWLGLAQRPDGALQTLLLVGAAGVALFALRGDLHPRMLAVPAGVLVAIGIAAALAQTHPAPVWPDAMRALPPAALRGDAAAVWHAEQIATGLIMPNVFWALLRCGSLAGCVVLAYASVFSSKYPAGSKSPLRAPA